MLTTFLRRLFARLFPHRHALRTHEEWEKVMEQKKQERQSNSLPPPAYHDYMNRQADSILKRLNRPKQTEGDE